MSNPTKDTIYIDPEEDITGIIDRLNTAKSNIVALVLPKRAQVLHSSVNMRLLKRAADSKNKKLVLISNEPSVMKLAAATRMYVAGTLSSQPEIPKEQSDEVTETISSEEVNDTEVDTKKSIGELAGLPEKEQPKQSDEEPIELDNIDVSEKQKEIEKPLGKMNKKLKVPNIDKFRNRIMFGVGGALAIGALFFVGSFILPKATIIIKTESTNLETKFEFTAKTDVTALDQDKKIFPSQSKELKIELSDKVTATGKVDKGNKATGSVTLYNCNKSDKAVTLATGTRLVVGEYGFVTNKEVTVPVSNFTGGGACKKDTSADVNVTAESGGDKYNISSRSGYTTSSSGDISGYGSDMGGGTTKLVSSISQTDIDTVKTSLEKGNTDKDKEALISQIKSAGLYPLTETFAAIYEAPTSNPAIGEEATGGTVTVKVTYTMLAVYEKDLTTVLTKVQESNITTATQKIYDNGLSKAKVLVAEKKSPTEYRMTFSTTATVGPFLEAGEIAKEIKGKSAGETKTIITKRPGISSVEVQYSPFWVYRTPNRLNKINIVFDGAGEVR
jgi:hypothetical protein